VLTKGGLRIAFCSKDKKTTLVSESYEKIGTITGKLRLPSDCSTKEVRLVFMNHLSNPGVSEFNIISYKLFEVTIKSPSPSQTIVKNSPPPKQISPIPTVLVLEEPKHLPLALHGNSDSLSVHTSPINKSGQPQGEYIIEGKDFKRQDVSGDRMRCFFNSMGLDFTKQIELLKQNSKNVYILKMIANEIINAARANSSELPESLKTVINFKLFQEEMKTIDELREKRNKALEAQSPAPEKRDPKLLSDELKNVDLLENEVVASLRERAETEDAFLTFLKDYIGKGNMMVAVPDVQGQEGDNLDGNSCSIDAIALLNEIELRIYRQDYIDFDEALKMLQINVDDFYKNAFIQKLKELKKNGSKDPLNPAALEKLKGLQESDIDKLTATNAEQILKDLWVPVIRVMNDAAIAELKKRNINIYSPHLQLTHKFIPKGAKKVACIYHEGAHFQALIPALSQKK